MRAKFKIYYKIKIRLVTPDIIMEDMDWLVVEGRQSSASFTMVILFVYVGRAMTVIVAHVEVILF